MASYRIAAQARADLDAIWDFLDTEAGESVADARLDRFHEGFRTLSEFPYMGRNRPEVAPNLRSFPVSSYIVLYRPVDDGVDIVHVRDSRRQEPEPGDILDA